MPPSRRNESVPKAGGLYGEKGEEGPQGQESKEDGEEDRPQIRSESETLRQGEAPGQEEDRKARGAQAQGSEAPGEAGSGCSVDAPAARALRSGAGNLLRRSEFITDVG